MPKSFALCASHLFLRGQGECTQGTVTQKNATHRISIGTAHVPITGLALLLLLLDAPLILLPRHVVFLELIIDPACSIVLEQEPEAGDLMRRAPRPSNARLIDMPVLIGSLGRGLIVLVAVVLIYLYAGHSALAVAEPAALAFTALVVGTLRLIVLHRVGRSPWEALSRPNRAFWAVVVLSVPLLAAITLLPGPGAWFGFAPVALADVAWAVITPL
jgi:P-type Ca2+ transporter type 2C